MFFKALEPGNEDIIDVYRAIANPYASKTKAGLNSIELTKRFLGRHQIKNYGQLARYLLKEKELIAFGEQSINPIVHLFTLIVLRSLCGQRQVGRVARIVRGSGNS